jgi:hypothetical protein
MLYRKKYRKNREVHVALKSVKDTWLQKMCPPPLLGPV